MTKKIIAIITILTILFVLPGVVGKMETTYTKEAKVVSIEDDTTIVVVDITGDEWAFEGTDFKVGDKVKLTIFNNYTDNTTTDDIIEDAKIVNK